jgi:putative membrane protein
MRTRRWIQTAILLMMGIYLIETLITGEISFYVAQRFDWLPAIGGVIFLALGVVSAVTLLREPIDRDEHEHEHEHEHNHAPAAPWAILAILALPLALGILVPAKPLSASAIGTSSISTSLNVRSSAADSQQITTAPADRNVLDWVKAFSSSTNPEEFVGQPADLIGFVYRDVRFKADTEFMVSRFTISCCVADASAIGIVAEVQNAASWPQDSWVHVKGKMQLREVDGQKMPVLVVESIEATETPAHPYLYP